MPSNRPAERQPRTLTLISCFQFLISPAHVLLERARPPRVERPPTRRPPSSATTMPTMPQVPCQAAPIARTLCRRLCVVAVAALSLVPVRAAAQPAPRPGSGILRTVGVEAAVTAATL